jgi:RNA polymerase-binding transcription factor DksA
LPYAKHCLDCQARREHSRVRVATR